MREVAASTNLVRQVSESSSSNAEISNNMALLPFKEKMLYSVFAEDEHLWLDLDYLIMVIGDYPSPSPPNAILNLVEQDLRKISWKPEYRNALALFLQRNNRLTGIHPLFFDIMRDLCFVDLSDTKVSTLPSSLFKLTKLTVLLVRNCDCLETLPPEIGELKTLEVLDLSGTELYQLPDEIGQLQLVKIMKLSFYGPDDESEYKHLPSRLVYPNFLSGIKGIQSLSIAVHPEDHRWSGETVACITKDISKLEGLSYLHFYFPQVEDFEYFIETSPSWKNQCLKRFNFTVGEHVKYIISRVPKEVEALFNGEKRCLRYIDGDKTSPLVNTVIIHATAFYLDHHYELQNFSEFNISSFRALKFCLVRDCPKMQVVLDGKKAGCAFPCLEYLGIYFLCELREIWKPPRPSRARKLKRVLRTPKPCRHFEALKYLVIQTCPRLQFVFRESMLQCLANLEELVVDDCEGMKNIIKGKGKKAKYRDDDALPKLRKLVLRYLPELVSLGCGVRLPEEKISVHACLKFESKSSTSMAE